MKRILKSSLILTICLVVGFSLKYVAVAANTECDYSTNGIRQEDFRTYKPAEQTKKNSNNESISNACVAKSTYSTTNEGEIYTYGIYGYTLNNNKATIMYCDMLAEGRVNIPDYIEGYQVVAIGDYAFEWCDAITYINIPSSVTSIGKGAFKFCLGLEYINVATNHSTFSCENGILYNKAKTKLICFPAASALGEFYFPDSLTTIVDYAFWGSGIINLNFSENISSIGEGAFGCCSNLQEINIASTNRYYSSDDGVLYNKAGTTLIHVPNLSLGYILNSVSVIAPYAYCGNLQGGGFDFTAWNITTIGKGAFAYCSYKTEFILGSNVSSIGEDAFYNCYNLSYITIPQKVKTINKNTFAYCSELQNVYFAGNIEKIDNSAFESCSSLNDISFPNSLKYIGDYAFMYSGIGRIDIPASVTHIGEYAFDACMNLKDIEVNSNNSYFCSLNDTLFNKSKTSLLQYAIANNTSSYVIPDGVKIIAKGAFEASANLIKITIPESVESIEDWAFWGCYELKDIYYLGDDSQWDDVYIAECNDSLFEAEMHFNNIISVTGISLNKTSTSIFVGDTETLVANITPEDATNKNVTWSSSNTNVASVSSSGVVTAKAEGTATITAKTVDGNKIATCTVTVKPITPTIEVESAYVQVGNMVDVTIKMDHNPGVALVGFNVNYDTNAMTLKSATLGEIFTGELECNVAAVPFVFNVYSGSANKTESGDLVTLQFEIKENCPEGDYNITLSNIETLNIDENTVDFDCINGKITVRDSMPGDVTGDGKVTRTDLLRLAKHFSGFVVEIDEAASDVTGDGKVTRTDLLRLAKHFSGFDVVLGK